MKLFDALRALGEGSVGDAGVDPQAVFWDNAAAFYGMTEV